MKTAIVAAVSMIGMGAMLSACKGSEGPEQDQPVPAVEESRRSGRLSGVESWSYQLQRIDLDELAASDHDLLVIDYANDAGEPFTAEEIWRLRGGGKIVLSYLSSGEAETHRPYWNPSWVSGEECDAPPAGAAPGWF